MNPDGYTAEVTGLSPITTEKDIYDFFAFCGTIEQVDLMRAGECACTAYVRFKEAFSLETAVFLSGATILDQRVCITSWGQHDNGFDLWNQPSWKLEDENDSTSSEGNQIIPSAGEAVVMAQDAAKTVLAKGYELGKDALNKAKAFEESYNVSASAVAKVTELSERIGLIDTIFAGMEAVKSVDERYRILDTTKSAVSATGKTAVAAANIVASSSYFSKGAFWASDALNRAAKAAADLSSQGVKNEKLA